MPSLKQQTALLDTDLHRLNRGWCGVLPVQDVMLKTFIQTIAMLESREEELGVP